MWFDAEQIAAATNGRVVRTGAAGPVLTDSRSFPAGAWFVALSGARFDAHDFVAGVVERGAAGVVVSSDVDSGPAGCVRVADTTRAFQDLGRAARARLGGKVVGLTGSAGKTTTRAMIALAVSPLGEVHQTTGNLNNQLGVPMTLLAAPEHAAVTVLEMGTSSPGEIAFLAEIGRPHVRLIVNVGPAHLEELGGLEGVAREKGALFDTAVPGDVLCRNLDDPFVARLRCPAGVREVSYGRDPGATVRLIEARVEAESLSTLARFATPEGVVDTVLPSPGLHLAHNAAGALAVAHALGVNLAQAAAALRNYAPVGMRLRAESLPDFPGVVFLNDAYNANPSSMEASLDVLAGLPGRRFAVLGDMLELGPTEGEWHDRIVAHAESIGLNGVFLSGERMSRARRLASTVFESDPELLAQQLRDRLQPGDRVLLKGSRGARIERVLDALRGQPGASH